MPVAHPPVVRRRAVELVRLGGKPAAEIARDRRDLVFVPAELAASGRCRLLDVFAATALTP